MEDSENQSVEYCLGFKRYSDLVNLLSSTYQLMNKKKYYPWLLVGLLWVIALLNYMDRQMISTMRPAIQIDIRELERAANFGRLMAVFMWVYGLSSLFTGIIADKLNRRVLIIGSLFIWSAVTFAMGFAETFEQLYWLRAFMGLSEAFYIPAGLAMIADHHSDRTRSLAVGIHLSGVYMGQALGGFGSTISAFYSWHDAFMLFGIIGIVYAILLVFVLKDYSLHRKKPDRLKGHFFQGLFRLFHLWQFWLVVLLFMIPSLPGWAIKNWAPTLISESLRIDMFRAGPLTTISISLSSLCGVLVGGYLSDRWLARHYRGRIFTSLFGLVLTIPALLVLAQGRSAEMVLFAASIFGLGFGIFDSNNMPILCQFVDVDQRATAYGFLNTAGICAGAVITDYLGRATDRGDLAKEFSNLALIVLLVVLIQFVFLKPRQV